MEHTFVKILADWLMIPIVLVALYAIFWRVAGPKRYDRYTRVFMAGITSYILAKFIGNAWQPEQLRPFEEVGAHPGAAYLNNPGFPSDHALLGFFLTLAVWYCTRNRMLTVIMAVLTVLMCFGRVLALVHTPLDIAGSLVITAISTLWYRDYVKVRLHKLVGKSAKS
jgi:membrane-associated phospholipid phosphatase